MLPNPLLGPGDYRAMLAQGVPATRIILDASDALSVMRWSPWAWAQLEEGIRIEDPTALGKPADEWLVEIGREIVDGDRERWRAKEPPSRFPTPWLDYEQYWGMVHALSAEAQRSVARHAAAAAAASTRSSVSLDDAAYDAVAGSPFVQSYYIAILAHTAHRDRVSGLKDYNAATHLMLLAQGALFLDILHETGAIKHYVANGETPNPVLGPGNYRAMVTQGWDPSRIVQTYEDAVDVLHYTPWGFPDAGGSPADEAWWPSPNAGLPFERYLLEAARKQVRQDREHWKYKDPPGPPVPWITYEEYWETVQAFARGIRAGEERKGDTDRYDEFNWQEAIEEFVESATGHGFIENYYVAIFAHTAHREAATEVWYDNSAIAELLENRAKEQLFEDLEHELFSAVRHYVANRRPLSRDELRRWIARIELLGGGYGKFSNVVYDLRLEEARKLLGLPPSYEPQSDDQLALCFDVIRMADGPERVGSRHETSRRVMVGWSAVSVLAELGTYRGDPITHPHPRAPYAYDQWVDACVHEITSQMAYVGVQTVHTDQLVEVIGGMPATGWPRAIDVVEQSDVDQLPEIGPVGGCANQEVSYAIACLARACLYMSVTERLARMGIEVATNAKDDIDLAVQWGSGKASNAVIAPMILRMGLDPAYFFGGDRGFWVGELIGEIVEQRVEEYQDPEELRQYADFAIRSWMADRQAQSA